MDKFRMGNKSDIFGSTPTSGDVPHLDINSLAFADEDTIKKAQEEYANRMLDYVNNNKQKSQQSCIKKQIFVFVSMTLIAVILLCTCFYRIGYNNHVLIVDNSPVVYITSSGSKYHKDRCEYVKKNTSRIQTTIDKAEIAGYAPCSKCHPDKLK